MITTAAIVPMLPLLVRQLRNATPADLEQWSKEAADAVREYIPEPDVVLKLATLSSAIAAELRKEG